MNNGDLPEGVAFSMSNRESSKGFVLIIVTVLALFLFLILSATFYFSIQQLKIAKSELLRVQTHVLAESGLAKGIWLVNNSKDFYTDDAYSGPKAGLKSWVVLTADGVAEAFNDGYFKIVKEKEQNRLFSIGYLGESIGNATARKVIQLDYDFVGEKFVRSKWKEL